MENTQQQSIAGFPSMCSNLAWPREIKLEEVLENIYLTKDFTAWNECTLRAHGFTHIIIIDKHIQELFYPPPAAAYKENTKDAANTQSAATSHFLNFGKNFQVLDLNFGEKSYLITVLPNCYRAVNFIDKALQANGRILVIDCNCGEQKCITIIVAHLMHKYNINFRAAFVRLKDSYDKADLDRFYMTQLYEYEPILKVHRAQSRGNSCSRDLHAATLKRKNSYEDVAKTEVLSNFNPLTQFDMAVPTDDIDQL